MKEINPKMIVLARHSRGISQTELSEKTGIPQDKISRIENELVNNIKEEDLKTIATLLEYPESFFNQSINLYPPNIHYRKRANISQKTLQKADSLMNIYRVHIEKILESIELPNDNVPVIDNEIYDTPKKIAQFLRSYWGIPKGAIDDLTSIIEKKGIIVVHFDFENEKIDGRSMSTETGHYIIFLNKNLSGDRARLTLAHELGHIIMHLKTMPTYERDTEKEAFEFGAELLMPISEIYNELSGKLSLPKLCDLKRIWKVSIAALIYWAESNELITQSHGRYLWSQINVQGWRKNEPIKIALESTTLIDRMLGLMKNELGYSDYEMAKMFHINQSEFVSKFDNKPNRPMLRIA